MSEKAAPAHQPPTGGHAHSGSKAALAVGAIGIVFGDIGTSPLYAFRETFAGTANIAIDASPRHNLFQSSWMYCLKYLVTDSIIFPSMRKQ